MKVYQYNRDGIPTDLFHDMYLWCCKNLGEEYFYGDQPTWHHRYPSFYFVNEQDYIFFLLRWS
jgi:hypothetical protein